MGSSRRIWFVRRFEKGREGPAWLCRGLAGVTEGEAQELLRAAVSSRGLEELVVASPSPTMGGKRERLAEPGSAGHP